MIPPVGEPLPHRFPGADTMTKMHKMKSVPCNVLLNMLL